MRQDLAPEAHADFVGYAVVDRRAHHQPQRVAHALEAAERVLLRRDRRRRARTRAAPAATTNRSATSQAPPPRPVEALGLPRVGVAQIRRPPRRRTPASRPHGRRAAARGRRGGRAQARVRVQAAPLTRQAGVARRRRRTLPKTWPPLELASSSNRVSRVVQRGDLLLERSETRCRTSTCFRFLRRASISRPCSRAAARSATSADQGGRTMMATLALAVAAALGPPILELEHDVLMGLGDDNRVGFAFSVLHSGRGCGRGLDHCAQPCADRRRREGARGAPGGRPGARGARWSLRARPRDRRRVLAVPRAQIVGQILEGRVRGRRLADRVARVGLRRAHRAHRAAVGAPERVGPWAGYGWVELFFRANPCPHHAPTIVPPIPDYYDSAGPPSTQADVGFVNAIHVAEEVRNDAPSPWILADATRDADDFESASRRRSSTPAPTLASRRTTFPSRKSRSSAPTSAKGIPPAARPGRRRRRRSPRRSPPPSASASR